MKLNEFTNYLADAADRELRFVLPDGGMVEAHAHVTEVGRIDKAFEHLSAMRRSKTRATS